MTQKEVKALTDRQLRVKVAELYGFRWLPGYTRDSDYAWHPKKSERVVQYTKSEFGELWLQWIPDFAKDLNVMHEAEKLFNARQLLHYELVLEQLCGNRCFIATARQRAEAFVLTMGDKKKVPDFKESGAIVR